MQEFVEHTVTQFEKALEIRRALIARRIEKVVDVDEAMTEVGAVTFFLSLLLNILSFSLLLNILPFSLRCCVLF